MPFKDIEVRRAHDRAWYLRNRDKKIKRVLDALHHKTGWRGRRKALLEAQEFLCAACGTDDPVHTNGWQLDHNHETGKIRGVLCGPCNLTLGNAHESIPRLGALIDYLRKHA